MTILKVTAKQLWMLPETFDERNSFAIDHLPAEQRFTCRLFESLKGYIEARIWRSNVDSLLRRVGVELHSVHPSGNDSPDIADIVLTAVLPEGLEAPGTIAEPIIEVMRQRVPLILDRHFGDINTFNRPSDIVMRVCCGDSFQVTAQLMEQARLAQSLSA